MRSNLHYYLRGKKIATTYRAEGFDQNMDLMPESSRNVVRHARGSNILNNYQLYCFETKLQPLSEFLTTIAAASWYIKLC